MRVTAKIVQHGLQRDGITPRYIIEVPKDKVNLFYKGQKVLVKALPGGVQKGGTKQGVQNGP